MENTRPIINTGFRQGLITVGELVRNVQQHPLFASIPKSYLKQGRLRECECDCGRTVLYSEAALAVGQIKSCGCLLRAKREQAHKHKVEREEIRNEIRKLKEQIGACKLELSEWKLKPIAYRDSQDGRKRCTELADTVRQLYGRLGNATKRYKDLLRVYQQQKYAFSLDSPGDQ